MFVTDGIRSALEQAKGAAAEKDVRSRAGLVDEMLIPLASVILGGGVGLFEGVGEGGLNLEKSRLSYSPEVAHVLFRVVG